MVLDFGLVYVVDYVYRLAYVELALRPHDDFYLIMTDVFSCAVAIGLSAFYWRFFIYIPHGYWPEVFFLVESLQGFGIRMMLVL